MGFEAVAVRFRCNYNKNSKKRRAIGTESQFNFDVLHPSNSLGRGTRSCIGQPIPSGGKMHSAASFISDIYNKILYVQRVHLSPNVHATHSDAIKNTYLQKCQRYSTERTFRRICGSAPAAGTERGSTECRPPRGAAPNRRHRAAMSRLSEIGRRGTLRISIIKKAEGCSSRLTFPILVIVLDNLSL